MYIIYIRNYKFKFVLVTLIVLLLFTVFTLTSTLLTNSLIFKVTVNENLTLSYPFRFQVDNIYISEQVAEASVQTNLSFRKPVTQKFQNYESIQGKFSFSYPTIFSLGQKDFAGSDILYHIDFNDKDRNTHGFVQVWNMPYSLEEFLNRSKLNSQQNFKSFNTASVSVSNQPGYLWDYTVMGNDGKYYKGSEVFFKKGDKMYRISYFVPEASWNKKESDTFWHIVNSFKAY